MAGARAKELSEPDPEFAEAFSKIPKPPPNDLTGDAYWQAARAAYGLWVDRAKERFGPTPEDITLTETTVTARDGYDIAIRIYTPKMVNKENRAPLAVFFHGGGFCQGDMWFEEGNCRMFSQRLGGIAINVEYRLAPEFPYPHAPLDGWDVLKWVSSNADNLNADLKAGFLVGGVSAGGNISAVLSYKALHEELSPPLTGACLLVPGLQDQRQPVPRYEDECVSIEQNKDAPVIAEPRLTNFLNAYNGSPTDPLFSILNVGDLSGLPPTVVFVAGQDPLRDEALIYERRLREEVKVPTYLKVFPGVPHGFWLLFPEFDISKRCEEAIYQAFSWLLNRQG